MKPAHFIKSIYCTAFVLAIAALYGWVMNIVGIVNTIHGDVTAMFIARCVGLFIAPMGAVLGYF